VPFKVADVVMTYVDVSIDPYIFTSVIPMNYLIY